MLIVVIFVILMVVGFVWKYCVSNKDVKYSLNWLYFNKVEVVVWMVFILIIIFFVVLIWKIIYVFEFSKLLVYDEKFIIIEVVFMDWKWFFIYLEQGIVIVNEIVFLVNILVYFKVIFNFVMNFFFILCLGSQIYVMVGMQICLYLIVNEFGIYDGIFVSYSGLGFLGMKFKVIVILDCVVFDQWVVKVKQLLNIMFDMAVFEKLVAFSEYNQVEYFFNVKLDLFVDVINKFMVYGKSMDMIQLEGEYSVYEGMEGMDMSYVEFVY